MKSTWVAVGVLLLAACNQPAAPEPQSDAGGVAAPMEAPIQSPAATPTAEADSGRYTQLVGGHCRTEQIGDELGGTRTTCAGEPPYALVVTDSDARQALAVAVAEGKPQPLELASRVSAAFSDLGDTVEWRPLEGTPTAMIVRFNAYDTPKQPERATSFLVVVKLERPACIVDVVPAGPDQNAKARDIADGAVGMACRANDDS